MIKKYSIWLFVAAVVLLPVGVFAIVKWYEHGFTKLPVLGPEHHSIADYQLVNQYGATTSIKDWNDKIVVANLFFTHCPVVCPKMIRNLKKVQQLYAGDEELMINSFTVDPERDSVGQLLEYATRMDIQKNWQLITGSKKDIYKLARKSFLVVATDGDGGPDDFIHSELLILIDKQKRIRGFYNGTVSGEVDDLLRDINRLKRKN
ncbi:MAG TPA: SCO family protein [Flavisolibacter sp.]|nr:SCO family protein [Flavisolibacter sp.]